MISFHQTFVNKLLNSNPNKIILIYLKNKKDFVIIDKRCKQINIYNGVHTAYKKMQF